MGNYYSNKLRSLLLGACFLVLISCSSILILAQAGREAPKEAVVPSNFDSDVVKHPDSFIDVRDGSYLVPGLGRFVLPRPGQDPLNYNPITGNSGGGLGGIGDDSAGATHQYIPGGDDTFFNNPGFEIPIPGAGGAIP